MSSITRRNQNWLPSIFNNWLEQEWAEPRAAATPAINVKETKTEYKVEVAAPGMCKEDFKVGINENGDCPSAVKSDYSEWWGNHYDSPSFLSMMLYDYVDRKSVV